MQQAASYAEAIRSKFPESVVIVVARDERGRDNPITLGWSMITSSEPHLFAVAINARAYTVGAIRHSRAFVLAFPAAAQAQDALFFGTHSGRDANKLGETHSPTQPATIIEGALLSDAVANFECVLESELPTGDHILFVGRVVASHRNTNETAGRLYSLGDGGLGPALAGEVLAR